MNKDLNSGTYSGTEVVHLTRRSCKYSEGLLRQYDFLDTGVLKLFIHKYHQQ